MAACTPGRLRGSPATKASERGSFPSGPQEAFWPSAHSSREPAPPGLSECFALHPSPPHPSPPTGASPLPRVLHCYTQMSVCATSLALGLLRIPKSYDELPEQAMSNFFALQGLGLPLPPQACARGRGASSVGEAAWLGQRLGEIWVLPVTTTGVIFRRGGTSYCDLIQDPPLGESSAQVCVCVCVHVCL